MRNRYLYVFAIIANLAAIIQFGNENKWLYVLLIVVFICIFVAETLNPLFFIYKLRKLLAEAEQLISHIHGFRPKRVVAFDRSSAIFAGMLCQRMAIGEIISLPRFATNTNDITPRSVTVGAACTIQLSDNELKETLVLVFNLRTGSTLEAGLRALSDGRNCSFPGKILALYATDGGIALWPNVLVVRKCTPGEVPNERLPWIEGPYVHK